MSVISLATSAVLGLSLLLNWISLGTVSWTTGTMEGFGQRMGLWRSCGTAPGIEVELCGNNPDFSPEWMKASGAMMILAMLAVASAVASSLLSLFLKNQKKILLLAAGCAAIAATLCSFIAVMIWGIRTKKDLSHYDLGWSFALGVVHSIVALIGGILAFWGASNWT